MFHSVNKSSKQSPVSYRWLFSYRYLLSKENDTLENVEPPLSKICRFPRLLSRTTRNNFPFEVLKSTKARNFFELAQGLTGILLMKTAIEIWRFSLTFCTSHSFFLKSSSFIQKICSISPVQVRWKLVDFLCDRLICLRRWLVSKHEQIGSASRSIDRKLRFQTFFEF